MNREKLMKMAGAVRTGGKGSMRRKKKAVHKATTTDDKRLQSTLKRIGVNAIPAIEEVNIFKDDVVIQFTNPKVQASIAANTWVVSGSPQSKKLQDILPGIINQLGPDNLDNLRKLAEQFQKQSPNANANTGAANPQEEDDDEASFLCSEARFQCYYPLPAVSCSSHRAVSRGSFFLLFSLPLLLVPQSLPSRLSEVRSQDLNRREISSEMNREKLMKKADAVRLGGKGTVRRKKKAVHKATTTDDKRLQSTLKRIGVNTIPAIEEVNIFKDDVVIQFTNPKVQASIAANTWVVSGSPQSKKLQDILPGIINQLGPDNMDNLRKLAEQFQKQAPHANGKVGATNTQENDDVPELVGGETFEAAAEEGQVGAS
ncbi:hypothetical protein Ancab_016844 [Ancistrocladus abbreviatus]